MKIVIKTTIKDNVNVIVKESVKKIHELLLGKGGFILVTRIDFAGNKSAAVLSKGCIKMVKEEPELKTIKK